jgi:hypothetical protein
MSVYVCTSFQMLQVKMVYEQRHLCKMLGELRQATKVRALTIITIATSTTTTTIVTIIITTSHLI